MSVTDADDAITEITTLEATKVAGVRRAANQTAFVVLKAKHQGDGPDSDAEDPNAAPETPFGEQVGHKLSDEDQAKFKENTQDIKEGKKPTAKAEAEPHEEDANSPEANAQQDEMTDEAAKAAHEEGAFCGDSDCVKCVERDDQSYRLRPGIEPLTKAARQSKAYWNAVIKAKADPNVGGGVDRDKIPAEDFAGKDRSFPIVTPGDVSDAASSIGRAGDKNFSSDKLKENIISIARRKGAKHVAELPKKWQAEAKKADDEAAKGAVQDALNGTNAPEYVGTIDGSKQSIAPATAGVKTDLGSVIPTDQDPSSVPGVVARLRGGESAYNIPAEAKAYTVANPGPTGPQIAHVGAVKAVSSLFEAMDQIDAQRKALKAGDYLQVPGPGGDASAVPGSMPWETYDAATLDQVASVLAQCCNAVECICTREQIEALTNDPSDQQDAWDLQQVQDCLDCAAGIVARLAYAEGAEAMKFEGDLEKAYSRLRAGDEKALRSAHAALSNVLAEHDRAKQPNGGEGADVEAGSSEPSEGDKIQMELTKEELADQIAASTKKAVADAQKAEAKKAAKARKAEARKAERKAQRTAEKALYAQFAQKNANNAGDITVQQMEDGVNGEHDADDIQMVGGKPDPKYTAKALKKAMKKAAKKQALAEVKGQLKALSAETQTVGQLVKSFANRPRSGGPVLDGIPRGGLFAASENRLGDGPQGGPDRVIKSLEDRIEKSSDALERQTLGLELTKMRLSKEAADSFGDFKAYGQYAS
jgi:hypothetical protein